MVWLSAGIIGLSAAGIAILYIRLKSTNKRVARELGQTVVTPFKAPGSIKRFTLMPLVEYYGKTGYATEAGVSYMIRADATCLLMDVGANAKREHPSPLVLNMKKAGVDPVTLDGIIISHIHEDHVGGIREEKQRVFSLSRGRTALPAVPVWAPEPIECAPGNPGPCPVTADRPLLIGKGIALTGPLPASLFLLGYTLEQSVVFNLESKGLVVVIGCGHPTVEVILNRAIKMFDTPVYAVIGGIHLPVHGGRMNLGPLNLQNIVGSDRMPWNGLNKDDVFRTIEILRKHNPALVAVSAHDSSDWAIDKFSKAFGARYQTLEAGTLLEL